MSRPTIADVARSAEVSTATVNRVLAGRSNVRPETAMKILKAAEELGFYGAAVIRKRIGSEAPKRSFGFLLQQESMPFHRRLGLTLKEAVENATEVRGTAVLEFDNDLSPENTVARLRRLSESCHAIAIVSADHPLLTRAIEDLNDKGIPVFSLVSGLNAPTQAHVGVEERRLGRVAAWFATRIPKDRGKLGILLGSHRHLCQEQREIGFRSFVREHMPEWEILDSVFTHELDRIAVDVTETMLKKAPDLKALFIAGGGVLGCLEVISKYNSSIGGELCAISVEWDESTRTALHNGVLTAVLAHPLHRLASELIREMIGSTTRRAGGGRSSVLLPFDTFTPEHA